MERLRPGSGPNISGQTHAPAASAGTTSRPGPELAGDERGAGTGQGQCASRPRAAAPPARGRSGCWLRRAGCCAACRRSGGRSCWTFAGTPSRRVTSIIINNNSSSSSSNNNNYYYYYNSNNNTIGGDGGGVVHDDDGRVSIIINNNNTIANTTIAATIAATTIASTTVAINTNITHARKCLRTSSRRAKGRLGGKARDAHRTR